MEEKLKLAIKKIKSGDKEAGKELLLDVLNTEPENDKAWVWMSAVVDSDELRRECLEEALMYNPFNETAQRGLAKINARQPKTAQNDNGRETAPNNLPTPNQEDWTYVPPLPQPPPQTDEFSHEHAPQDGATSYTIKELAKFTKKENIATKLAVTGMDFDQALKFVNEIERTKSREIELRRLPLVIGVCTVLVFMGGIWTLSIFWGIRDGYAPSMWAFIVGIPMFFSGVAGLINSAYKIMKGADR